MKTDFAPLPALLDRLIATLLAFVGVVVRFVLRGDRVETKVSWPDAPRAIRPATSPRVARGLMRRARSGAPIPFARNISLLCLPAPAVTLGGALSRAFSWEAPRPHAL